MFSQREKNISQLLNGRERKKTFQETLSTANRKKNYLKYVQTHSNEFSQQMREMCAAGTGTLLSLVNCQCFKRLNVSCLSIIK